MFIKIPARSIAPYILEDLPDKMVFIGGPRQVGKTTLSKSLFNRSKKSISYLNWDIEEHRQTILTQRVTDNAAVVIFDELHKYSRWRNLLKGYFDRYQKAVSFLVTGSARLDIYRRGGDSLQGRYFYYRLNPLSLGELGNFKKDAATHLFHYGGFPEPFLKGDQRFLARWQKARIETVVREDLRDLQQLRDVSLISILLDSLPERITSPLSVNAIAKQIGVLQPTIENWLTILEKLYAVFRLPPYGANGIRAVKKEKKIYFYDWTMCTQPGARFENMVACNLLKYCHFLEDTLGKRMELKYLRDTDSREVDFVVLENNKPLFAVECKYGSKEISSAINYFKNRTSIPEFFQVHMQDNYDSGKESVDGRIMPYWRFCEIKGI